MDFKSFLQNPTNILIGFSSRDENKLLNFLKGLNPELWIDNPFKVEDLINHISITAVRDLKISQLLGEIDEMPPIVVDLNMITYPSLYKKDFSFIKENKRKLIILVRVISGDVKIDSLTIQNNNLFRLMDMVFVWDESSLKLIKSRNSEYFKFNTNL